MHLLPESADDWPLEFRSVALTETFGATYQLVASAHDSRGAVLAQARVQASFGTRRAPLAQAGDLYGTAVALAPDALLVSALGENGGSKGVGGDPNRRDGPQTGAAYLYAKADDGWKLSTYIKASNPGARDNFGWMLALGPDYAVIGAHSEDGAGSGIDATANDGSADSGAVYVFE